MLDVSSLAFSPYRHQHHTYTTGRDTPEDPSYPLQSHTLYNAVPRAIAPRHQLPQPQPAPLTGARAYTPHSPSRSVSPMDVQYASYPSSHNPTFSFTSQHYKSAHLTPSPSPMDHKSFALAQIQPSPYSPSAFTFDPFAPDEDIEDTSSSSEEYGTMPPATPPSAPQHTLVGLPPTAIGYSNGFSDVSKSSFVEAKGTVQDPSVEAYGQYVARQQRIDFLRQREWMRRVTAWVDTVNIGSPQHQELPHARQRAYNPSRSAGTPVPQRNTPPRHRRQPQQPAPAATPRAHVPSPQHFVPQPLPAYDNNTQIYYTTPNHAAAPSPSPSSAVVEMTDDEPYLIYSTSGPSEPSRQVERRSSAESLLSSASSRSSSAGRSRSLSPNATVYTPRHQQRASIPSSVPFPSSAPQSSSFSSLRTSLSAALGPVAAPPGVPCPVTATAGRRAHSRVPSLDSIKEEEEV
ncbi:uncharacterized protein STEHIDRAFT_140705 [Stereum hirsutum FP-91666 SS1]|uniref:uncharacterized protein n=1 Tax=Stereum hirsutum (strain FP-91666) TaxID=721885 RepID=UPI0004449652|nr:uncharacterized protein STEHIDRAFT_140705 [Stereum hirsutum FP-91666 SS1]EIM84435.1 hypothetical protein STEHIDRAFT_140705 [Stereum hirsutum FP-91666 SS1]